MFTRALIASAALMATAATAQSVGSAVVVNMCDYEVRLCNVPAADGGYEEYDTWLGTDKSNRTYSQTFTQLSNGDGWSIKLGQSEAAMATNIMQYEYTYQGDDIIWYDLSDVNGNPWDGNWEITASSDSGACNPKQQAYRYATDDAYGMQACPQDSVITVTLCSGDDSDDSGAASASSSVAAATSSEATATSTFTTPSQSAPTQYTSSATAESSATTSSAAAPSSSAASAAQASSSASATPSTTVVPTTLVTSSIAVYTPHPGVTITEVQTAVVTDVVTATYWHHGPNKRHNHRRHGAGVL